MAARRPTPDYVDVPDTVLRELRAICGALPETTEQQAWIGRRWMIRKRTFAHVFAVDGPNGMVTAMQFRCEPVEFDILCRAGHPFFRAGWGHNVMTMVLDDRTDWVEVGELLTESYCTQAPRKLVERVGRPAEP